ncbi:recombinase family protein [Lysinibacillus yapensis]|uniref:Recombinase family protein n=1 Tax=Ureibacillus yapensis TaxID=2304605 RepID=A0A396SAT9_9BACL|nr:recombinase family protein [Lysinibacillus yapensis]
MIEEVITGVAEEKELNKLIGKMQKGDKLVVTRLDRLGRNTLQLLQLIEEMKEKELSLVIMNIGFDVNTEVGQAVLTILSSFAQLERDMLKEKQRIGIESARKRGVHLGRKPKYSKKSFEKAVLDYLEGMTVGEVSDTYNIPRSTFYKFLKDECIQR